MAIRTKWDDYVLKRWPESDRAKNVHLKRFRNWELANINTRASNVRDKYKNFTYIIEVDYRKVYGSCGFDWNLVQEIQNMTYPARPLGENLVIGWERGDYDDHFIFNIIALGGDVVYAATNNEADALLLSLKYQ